MTLAAGVVGPVEIFVLGANSHFTLCLSVLTRDQLAGQLFGSTGTRLGYIWLLEIGIAMQSHTLLVARSPFGKASTFLAS